MSIWKVRDAATAHFVGECAVHEDRAAIGCPDCLPESYPEQDRRAKIVDFARTLVGIPYLPNGMTRGGLGCMGIAYLVAQEFGFRHRPVQHPDPPDSSLMRRQLAEQMVEVHALDALPGDVLFCAPRRHPTHAMLLGLEGRIIESKPNTGKVQERTLGHRWAARVACAWRFEELDHG